MATGLEQYASEALALGIGIAGGIIIRAKLWWKAQSAETRKEIILDTMDKLSDGRYTITEAKDTVKKFL